MIALYLITARDNVPVHHHRLVTTNNGIRRITSLNLPNRLLHKDLCLTRASLRHSRNRPMVLLLGTWVCPKHLRRSLKWCRWLRGRIIIGLRVIGGGMAVGFGSAAAGFPADTVGVGGIAGVGVDTAADFEADIDNSERVSWNSRRVVNTVRGFSVE